MHVGFQLTGMTLRDFTLVKQCNTHPRLDTRQGQRRETHTCDGTRSKVEDVRVFRAGPARNHAEPICADTESGPVCVCVNSCEDVRACMTECVISCEDDQACGTVCERLTVRSDAHESI
jgi:hypothetical protein